MTGEFEEKIEGKTSSGGGKTSSDLTLQKAVDMGEYHPDYLSTFPEWQRLSRIMMWEMIRSAIKNRRRFLLVHWAEINNQLDFSKKPHLQKALENIEKQLNELRTDEEKYQVEYSI